VCIGHVEHGGANEAQWPGGGTRLLRSQQRRDGGTRLLQPRQRQLPVDLAKVPSGAPLPTAMALASPNLKVSQSDASVWLQLRIIPVFGN
jgi:hypothetical protein